MKKVIETKKRHLYKSIIWRVIATINSFFVLSLGFKGNFKNAILMNITGMIVMYFFERVWSKYDYGRFVE
jgi:uncharacterized membrane protein